jgi:hypothetical protein
MYQDERACLVIGAHTTHAQETSFFFFFFIWLPVTLLFSFFPGLFPHCGESFGSWNLEEKQLPRFLSAICGKAKGQQ